MFSKALKHFRSIHSCIHSSIHSRFDDLQSVPGTVPRALDLSNCLVGPEVQPNPPFTHRETEAQTGGEGGSVPQAPHICDSHNHSEMSASPCYRWEGRDLSKVTELVSGE